MLCKTELLTLDGSVCVRSVGMYVEMALFFPWHFRGHLL
jgi:hypothetical protein